MLLQPLTEPEKWDCAGEQNRGKQQAYSSHPKPRVGGRLGDQGIKNVESDFLQNLPGGLQLTSSATALFACVCVCKSPTPGVQSLL